MRKCNRVCCGTVPCRTRGVVQPGATEAPPLHRVLQLGNRPRTCDERRMQRKRETRRIGWKRQPSTKTLSAIAVNRTL